MGEEKIPTGWKRRLLFDLIETPESGIRPRGGVSTETGIIPSIGAEFITGDGRLHLEGMKYVPEEFFNGMSSGKLKKGDVLICKDGALTGKVAFYDKDYYPKAAVNEHVFILRPKNGNSAKFIFYALQSLSGKAQLKRIMTGSAQPGITTQFPRYFSILEPPRIEQEKIAEILTAVDENLEETDQLIEKYARLKISLLRKLFTKGIEAKKFQRIEVRRGRYEEIPAHWEWTTLGAHTTPTSGSTPSKKVPGYFKGAIPWVTTVDLNYDVITKPTEYITEEAVKSAHLKIHPKGTFLVAITGLEAAGTRGRCGLLGIDATTSQSCVAFITDDKVLPEFLFYWYQLWSESIISLLAQGTKQQSLNVNLVKTIRIALPLVDEQKRMVHILKQVDESVRVNLDKKKANSELKKALMQKLLSGEIRVKVTA